ncbi:MAG: HEAT repeat domain-containing protein [Chloroflexota bacterium]
MGLYTELDDLSFAELAASFQSAPPDGNDYAFTYYTEVALLIHAYGNPGVKFLIEETIGVSSAKVRAVIFALTQTPEDDEAIHTLVRGFLDDDDPLIVAETIDGFTRQNKTAQLPQVLPLLGHDSPYIRGSVLRFMAGLYPEQAVPLLINSLQDSHFIVRENAVDELGELEAIEALPALRAISDPHPHVRQAVETAIEELEAIEDEEMVVPPNEQPPYLQQPYSFTLPNQEAVSLLIQAIDHYLDLQQPITAQLRKDTFSGSGNRLGYLEALKTDLKSVDTRVLS